MDEKLLKQHERFLIRRKRLIEKISKMPLKTSNAKVIKRYGLEEKKTRLALFKIKHGIVGEKDTEEELQKVINGSGSFEWKSCTNKVAYFSAEALKKACVEVSLRTEKKQFGYYCEFCDAFHSTSHPIHRLENINFFEKK